MQPGKPVLPTQAAPGHPAFPARHVQAGQPGQSTEPDQSALPAQAGQPGRFGRAAGVAPAVAPRGPIHSGEVTKVSRIRSG